MTGYMIIQVNMKQIGSRRKKIRSVPFVLEGTPHTVRELIEMAVSTCVREYNRRVREGENKTLPLSPEDIEQMTEIGRVAFGINYGGREADASQAVGTAVQAYEDGLIRIFIGDDDAGDIDSTVSISENDTVTFIRLVMLAGSIW